MTVPGGLERKRLDGLAHRVGIVDVADAGPQRRAQGGGIQLGQVGLELDRADPVLAAFLDA